MRWRNMRRSTNVEDVRGRRSAVGAGGLKLGAGGLIAILAISLLLGKNPLELLSLLEQQTGGAMQEQAAAPAASDEGAQFVSAVLGDTEDTWARLFERMDRHYQPPKLVLFRGAVRSACGFASAAVGPFYCPGEARVYLSLDFFDELHQRFGAPGDFAQAYVIAHEVGHHVQNLVGIAEAVAGKRGRVGTADSNALSVRQELQADCFAGVWGHFAARRELLESGDVQEGLAAAAAIGDDRLQRQSGGEVTPESFTHGSSNQRVKWFRTGLESGDPGQCDTFSAAQL